jgi:membrane-bound lytic murein transglycosylase D
MLKKTVVKAGFFGHGFLFLAVSPYQAKPFGAAEQGTPPPVVVAQQPQSLPLLSDSMDKKRVALPVISWNKEAAQYSQGFIRKNREDLEAVSSRAPRYFKIMEPVLERYGLPAELKYLAIVESSLKPSALSGAGAKGPWQLMGSTGRAFGLKVGGGTDERTHTYKSTVAAAKYLKQLHAELDDWLLVVAAYNSGSAPVLKAIRKAGTRNFWKLQRYLPAETRAHVKHFIGTHYYFQPEGSLTVLTGSEAKAYQKALLAYALQERTQGAEDSIMAIR